MQASTAQLLRAAADLDLGKRALRALILIATEAEAGRVVTRAGLAELTGIDKRDSDRTVRDLVGHGLLRGTGYKQPLELAIPGETCGSEYDREPATESPEKGQKHRQNGEEVNDLRGKNTVKTVFSPPFCTTQQPNDGIFTPQNAQKVNDLRGENTPRARGKSGKEEEEVSPPTPPGDEPVKNGEVVEVLTGLGHHYSKVIARGFTTVIVEWQRAGLTRAELYAAIERAHDQLPPATLPESPNYYRWAVRKIIEERGEGEAGPSGPGRKRKPKASTNGKGRISHAGLTEKNYSAGASTDAELDRWLGD